MNPRFPRSIFRARSAFRPSRPRGWKAVSRIEVLEVRRLLTTTVNWISPTSGSWDVATNWSPAIVPGPGDDVDINVTGVTVTISSNVESVNSITADDPLVISGGGLTVAASSTISGGLTMTGGSLTASGTGADMTVMGATTVSSASVYTQNGATVALVGLAGVQSSGVTIEATGAGSELELPNMTAITDTSYSDLVEAYDGGTVSLPSLADLTANVYLESEGQGSVLSIANLTTFTVGSVFAAGGSNLTAQDGGQIDSDSLTTIDGVTLTLSDTASISLGQMSNIDNSSVYVDAGAVLSLPRVTSYQGSGTLEATRTGSELDLPNLTGITDPSYSDLLEAHNGGTVNLLSLANVTANVELEAEGQDSVLNVSNLITFTVGSVFAAGGSSIMAMDGGQIDSGALTTINGVTLTLSDTASISLSQISNIDDSSIYADAGAVVSLPGLMNYQSTSGILEATGAGSEVDLPNLTSITDTSSSDVVEAYNGGTVSLPSLESLSADVDLEAQGEDSVLSIPELIAFTLGNVIEVGESGLTAVDGGQLSLADLTTLDGISVTVSGADGFPFDQITSFTNSTLNVSGGMSNCAALSDIVDSNITVSGGASLLMPAVTQLNGANLTVGSGSSLQVGTAAVSMPSPGTGATINVPQLPQGATYSLENSGTLIDSTFNIAQGDTIYLASGTYVGGTFNVSEGATLNLTGRETAEYGVPVTYAGTFTGSGRGTVLLSYGTLDIGLGGMTCNFPGTLLQWTGGLINTAAGNVTNLGTFNIAVSNYPEISDDGVLDNYRNDRSDRNRQPRPAQRQHFAHRH